MINIDHLSHAALFCVLENINWAENDDWQAIYPLLSEYSLSELTALFPNRKNEDEDGLRKILEKIFFDIAEQFDPLEHYYFQLPNLKISPEEAQTVLFKSKSPCRVAEINSQAVLTCPGDAWLSSDLIAKAFLMLGYLPPFVIQEPNGFEHEARNSYDRCVQYVRRIVDSSLYELKTLTERVK